jgi:SAM-dependent methyltransferase
MMTAKQVPPASVRNAPHIIEVLGRVLPREGTVLEIASGSGYHAAAFAAALAHVTWQPSDTDAAARASIAAYTEEAQLANLRPALDLDVMRRPWPAVKAAAIVCINMIHISPWEATVALFEGAARILPPAGLLFTYGPYILHGDYHGEGNVAFDQSLKARNPTWGLRDVVDIAAVAAQNAFQLDETVPMPANNLSLVWRKAG